jgi:hypothetical protein
MKYFKLTGKNVKIAPTKPTVSDVKSRLEVLKINQETKRNQLIKNNKV